MNHIKLWGDVFKGLAEQLPQHAINTWFEPIKPVALSNGELVLEVPNQFFYEWIESHYKERLLSALKSNTQNKTRPRFIISAEKTIPEPENIAGRDAKAPPKRNAPTLNRSFTFESFIEGSNNQFAKTAAQTVAENPGENSFNPLIIYGGVGLGKTHLIQAIGNKIVSEQPSKKVVMATSEKFTLDFVNSLRKNKTAEFAKHYRNTDVLLIDDIQFIAGKEQTQEGFFHTFNSLVTEGKQIVMSSDRPAKEIEHLHERLVSRMLGGLIVDIQQPDLETKVAILKSKSESLNANITGEILFYFAEQVTSNIRALEGCVNKIKAYVQLTNLSPDMNLAKSIVSELSPSLKNLTATKTSVIDAVSHHFGLSAQLVLGNSRNSRCVTARQIYMYILREDLNLSLAEICQTTGKKHSSVIYSCNQIINNLQSNSLLLDDLTKIRSTIERKLNN